MNKLTIIGNLTRDVELRKTQSGHDVANMSIAVNRRARAGEQEQTDYFRVTAWDSMAQTCAKYLAKGRKVCVIGSVSVSTYTGNDGTARAQMEVNAQDIEFVSSRQDDAQTEAPRSRAAAKPPQQMEYTQVSNDDLPF